MLQIKFILFFSFILVSTLLFSQLTKQQRLDSLRNKLSKDSAWIFRYKKVRPLFAIDQRNSFIHDNPIKISGFQVGVKLKERHDLGIGFYGVTPKPKPVDPKAPDAHDSVRRTLGMGYFTFFWEYELLHKKRWELGFPLEVGLGNYHLSVTDTSGHPLPGYKDKNGGFSTFGIGTDVSFNVWSWLGINGMVGYRFVSNKDPHLNFNGSFYSFGIKLSLGQVIRITRYKVKAHTYKKRVKEMNKVS